MKNKILVILLCLSLVSCIEKEKRNVIIVSDLEYTKGYYQEDMQTIEIKGIEKEVDRGCAIPAKWTFYVRKLEDINGDSCWEVSTSNEKYAAKLHKGDTVDVDIENYNNPNKIYQHKSYENDADIINIDNKVIIIDDKVIIIENNDTTIIKF